MKKEIFPIAVPFIAGAIVFGLFAMATGIVTPTSTSDRNIALARIDERAMICFDAATAHMAAAETVAAGVTPTVKQAVAADFISASGDRQTDSMVREACQRKLDA